ncbi:hypothetical protein NEIELOOT_01600 [Neisseria elongata subsp. glycolytica ATCC 29315]|uniref:Uncharacterized protein n=1 Tax=Neisseria elongata subsp. glycolytica ATCC 29315 TaxID=546263 RepID=D4DRA7_NEIEG|nr:hypothetical protein NEIELOOT_01600 [Neisseria elongata subsp. glycolytica ATCC 29315]
MAFEHSSANGTARQDGIVIQQSRNSLPYPENSFDPPYEKAV